MSASFTTDSEFLLWLAEVFGFVDREAENHLRRIAARLERLDRDERTAGEMVKRAFESEARPELCRHVYLPPLDDYCVRCGAPMPSLQVVRLPPEDEPAEIREDFGPNGDGTTPGFFRR